MCRIIEDMRNESFDVGMKEGIETGMKEAALRMLEAGKYDLEEIAAISGLSEEELEKLRVERNS